MSEEDERVTVRIKIDLSERWNIARVAGELQTLGRALQNVEWNEDADADAILQAEKLIRASHKRLRRIERDRPDAP